MDTHGSLKEGRPGCVVSGVQGSGAWTFRGGSTGFDGRQRSFRDLVALDSIRRINFR